MIYRPTRATCGLEMEDINDVPALFPSVTAHAAHNAH